MDILINQRLGLILGKPFFFLPPFISFGLMRFDVGSTPRTPGGGGVAPVGAAGYKLEKMTKKKLVERKVC